MAIPPAAKKPLTETEEEELPEGEDDEAEDDDEEDDEDEDEDREDDDEEEGEATANDVAEATAEALCAADEHCSHAVADGKKVLVDLDDGTKWVLTVRSRQ